MSNWNYEFSENSPCDLVAVSVFQSVSLQTLSTEIDRSKWIDHFDPLIHTVLELFINFITNSDVPCFGFPLSIRPARESAVKLSTALNINASIKSLCGNWFDEASLFDVISSISCFEPSLEFYSVLI
jgi:hypothetical protein